jgi:uncharacterized membrane protein
MSDTPVQVIVAAYPTLDGAAKRMAELEEVKKEGLIHVVDMAVVVKDADGKLKITNSKRRSTRGFVTGGVVGGLVGLLAGPVGWVALGGGALGALAGKVRGQPLKSELMDLGESLTPNSSAIVAVVEHTWVADIERELAAEGAKVVRDSIKADVAAQLEAGGSVLYSVAATSSGAAAVREVTSPSGTTVSGVIASGDVVAAGTVSETAQGAAPAEGVPVEHATLTDEAPPAGAAGATGETPKA